MRSLVVAGVALAAISLPTVAPAQEQTPEGAKQFLAQVLPGQRYNTNYVGGADDHLDTLDYASLYGTAGPVDLGRGDKCSVYFGMHTEPGELGNRRWSGADWTTHIDFAQVLEVKAEPMAGGTRIKILEKGSRYHEAFLIQPESLAKRVAYAMDFLRMACDPTKSTGF